MVSLPEKGLCWLACLLVLACGGCRIARETASLPADAVTAVIPGRKASEPDPALLQSDLLHYADDFSGRSSLGIETYALKVQTREGRREALSWKLGLNTAVVGIATGANPTGNLIDFLALATLTREVLEKRAAHAVPEGALDVWLMHSRELETNIWKLAGRFLTQDQQTELRAAATSWLSLNPDLGMAFFFRPRASGLDLAKAANTGSRPTSVFSLVGLDPTAGLDPAVREVTRSRLFAERALYALERMPFLVRWQTELLAEDVLLNDQVTNALASADRLSRAAESVSQSAAALPAQLTAERQAIVDALNAQEGKLRDLSAEVTRTLTAGERMTASLTVTITNFDALMKRFGVGEPSTSPPDTNSPPFNILDYARTAEQITAMAAQLNALLKDASGTVETPALDKRIADLRALSDRAKTDARVVLNHAFLLAGGLVLLFFVCAAVYRRFGRPPRAPSTGDQTSRATRVE